MNPDLPSLIGPAEWRDFQDSYRQRQTHVMPVAADPGRFAPLWSDWLVDAIGEFTAAPQDHERFRLISRGKTVAPRLYNDGQGQFHRASFQRLCASGASVALGNAEQFFNPALALSRQLEAELLCSVQVNLYITPGGGQGLGSHIDPHDVLILQLEGAKTWHIHAGADAADPAGESVLRAGGWLFLPKGMRHEVRNAGTERSVHLTVGFHPLTWGAVFERALQRARIAGPEMNTGLRCGETTTPPDDALLARLKSILPFVDLADHAAKYYANFPHLAEAVPAAHLPPASILDALDADRRLTWRPEAALTVAAATGPELSLPYRRAPLLLQSRWTPLLEAMRSAGAFTPRQLPADTELALLLCRLLAGVGVLATV